VKKVQNLKNSVSMTVKIEFFAIFAKFDCASCCCWDLIHWGLFHSLVGKQKAISTSWPAPFLLSQDIAKICNSEIHFEISQCSEALPQELIP
jgi:hypothetical protein